ncbi:hypothetical protein [Neisseria lactamica]|uniref:hypothetical protein n=1 Tax=Neisseria lactamica TaxID=486 RepID=UPI001EFD445A|nr:hypothetical protein [Neisseria lactamica]
MPSERTNSLQTAFCRQTDPQAHFFHRRFVRIQKSKITGSYQKNRNHPPSFPRRRESKAMGIYRKNRNFSAVIPAQAGIQIRKLQKFIGNN